MNLPAGPIEGGRKEQTEAVPERSAPDEEEHSPRDGQRLFRQEVIVEQQSQWLGTVLLAPSVSHNLFVTFAVLSTAAISGLLFFGDYTRKERINGWLVPDQGLVRVLAPQAGVVTELRVKNGDKVQKGTPLFTLSAEIQSEALGATQGEIVRRLRSRREGVVAERGLNQKLLSESESSLMKRIEILKSEEVYLGGQVRILKRQTELAERSEGRLQKLRGRGLVSVQRLEEARQALLNIALRSQAVELQSKTAMRERVKLEAELAELPLKSASKLAEIDGRIASLDQELAAAEARRRIVVTAAQAGTVTSVGIEQGSSASTNAALLSIVPSNSDLKAELFAPSRAIGFIKKGQEVLLRYKAFPYQKFGHYQGIVERVSLSAVNPNSVGSRLAGLTSMLRGDEPVYLVSVLLSRQSITAYGESVPLHTGMQLEADISIETRRLFEWVLDPLFTLTGKWQA